jgi:hypothetical protein
MARWLQRERAGRTNMITTPTNLMETDTNIERETEPGNETGHEVDAVASVKLDDVTGGSWYPYGGWGGWGGNPYAAGRFAPYTPARFAACERRADWFAAHAPVPAPGPGRYPWWGPC